ncbi:hypothetical protein [Paenisporosarcina indica]|uniref:hypothetical protein n=1 Tax=Paenisporosarcina indica TaxID=650093 RepID=UPI0009501E4F|nr:hypothetical protein [Paenisporosarcina indica]
MKRIWLSVFVIIAIVAFLVFLFINRADEHGKIGELEESNFVLYPIKVDPEADYNLPEIYFSNGTKVVGEVNSVMDLKERQEVKVWVEEIEGKKVANKIKILKE